MYAINAGVISANDISKSWQWAEWKKAPGGVSIIVDGQQSVRVTNKNNVMIFDCNTDQFSSHWYNYFNMDADHDRALNVLHSIGGAISRHVRKNPGIRILRHNPFEALLFGCLISWNDGSYYNATLDMDSIRKLGSVKKGNMADSGIVSRHLFPNARQIVDSASKLPDIMEDSVKELVLELCYDINDGWIDPNDLNDLSEGFPYIDTLAVDLATLYKDGSIDHIPNHNAVRSFLRARYNMDLETFTEWYLDGSEDVSGLVYQHALCCVMERNGYNGFD